MAPENQARDAGGPARVVGLGASAGGYDALEAFFAAVQPDSGLSFVVVSHHRRDAEPLLASLLDDAGPLSATTIEDGDAPRPNHVHVVPPGRAVVLRDGAFAGLEASDLGGGPAPLVIDAFFGSLAAERGVEAIGIVLSGTGSDGTLGLREIKAEGGIAIVQEPRTAKFSGMPESALSSGSADLVLAPDDMPEAVERLAFMPRRAQEAGAFVQEDEKAVRRILMAVKNRTGRDFSTYKPTTIGRRIERRMAYHQIDGLAAYAAHLEDNSREAEALFRDFLISVTTFFRDPEAFAALKSRALPGLITARDDEHPLRVWVPGCATGEEAYSLAMLIAETMSELGHHRTMQVFGTDLDPDAIEAARAGFYPRGIESCVDAERLERFFVAEDGGHRVAREIRQSMVFATHDLISDPPFTKIDLLSCRNLLIYLGNDVQRQVVPRLHYALRPGGVLFLGPSESTGAFNESFEWLDKKWKIYRARASAGPAPEVMEPARSKLGGPSGPGKSERSATAKPASGRESVLEVLSRRFVPASVIVDDAGEIQHVHGRTGRYLEPAAGRPSLNVHKMAREGLALELSAALRKARSTGEDVTRRGVRFVSNGGHERVDILVSRIDRPESMRGLFVVSFVPSSQPAEEAPSERESGDEIGAGNADERIDELERELVQTKDTLQGTIEEYETTNEELKSMNEELQSTNEELQSANEELETSKEEMQSLNEELQTVNAELQSKVDQLSQANDDMGNLLNSTDIATIFLDADLRVLRFTKQARKVVKLIEADVGRALGDIASVIQTENLEAAAKNVMDTLEGYEKEVRTASGDWYLMRMVPYRTARNVIEGLVMTFVDIDDVIRRREAEVKYEGAMAFTDGLTETLREPLLVLDDELRVVRASRAFYDEFGVAIEDTNGRYVYELGNGQWNIPSLRRLLEEVLPASREIHDYEVDHEFPRIGRRRMILNARRVARPEGTDHLILLAIEDLTGAATARPDSGEGGEEETA